jgi:CRISPR-associated protein Csm2
MALVSQQELRSIIINGDNQLLVDKAQQIAQTLVTKPELSTSQIRGIFGSVRRIELDLQNNERTSQARREFALLRPRLAYQAKREGGGVTKLRNELEPAITLVMEDFARFQNFVDFFEAILAYHKAKGGK